MNTGHRAWGMGQRDLNAECGMENEERRSWEGRKLRS